MKYTWEYKLECVDKYKSGQIIDDPTFLTCPRAEFHNAIRTWVRLYDIHGVDGLKHPPFNKEWKPYQKFELVSKVLAGDSSMQVAIQCGINQGLLYSWVKRYRERGMEGLECSKKGRPPKNTIMSKETKRINITQDEKEKLILLQARLEYLEAENAYLKKLDALVSKRETEHTKAKKSKLSKISSKKAKNGD